jgi:hypothetical protein
MLIRMLDLKDGIVLQVIDTEPLVSFDIRASTAQATLQQMQLIEFCS